MPATSVIGLQWGDEAKGKVVDLLTEEHEIVVRYQGGANAGHTVVTGGQTYKLSLIPSGIFRPQVQCVVASGVVINPASLLAEIDGLCARGIHVGSNLMVSDRAHVIFPWHIEEDRLLNERCSGGEAIGTTMRGIGPCYRDKVGRSFAIRLGDLYREGIASRIAEITQSKRQMLAAFGPAGQSLELDAAAIAADYARYAQRLKPFVGDTTSFLLDACEAGKRLLFEGAQGALLDIDHGTFPYVTASNSSGVGVSAGSGVPGRYVSRVIGIVKAYSTRVGGGPFPTEQDNETGQHIRQRGNEYGTVTRRPRRCGWFDALAVHYACRVNGIDRIALTKPDVLEGMDKVEICTAYKYKGKVLKSFPPEPWILGKVVPVYKAMPGWKDSVHKAREYASLPAAFKDYVRTIEDLIQTRVGLVSTGVERDDTILLERESRELIDALGLKSGEQK